MTICRSVTTLRRALSHFTKSSTKVIYLETVQIFLFFLSLFQVHRMEEEYGHGPTLWFFILELYGLKQQLSNVRWTLYSSASHALRIIIIQLDYMVCRAAKSLSTWNHFHATATAVFTEFRYHAVGHPRFTDMIMHSPSMYTVYHQCCIQIPSCKTKTERKKTKKDNRTQGSVGSSKRLEWWSMIWKKNLLKYAQKLSRM